METIGTYGSVGHCLHKLHITMASDRSDRKEERLIMLDSLFEKPVRFLGYDVCGIVTLVAYWRTLIALKSAVEVLVCVWVK